MKNNSDPFLNPSLGYRNTHLFYIRKSILLSLMKNIGHLQGILLDVGCGQMPYKELIMESGFVSSYIGLDLENNPIHHNNPDLLWNGIEIPLPVTV